MKRLPSERSITTLEGECERAEGFSIIREPDTDEKMRIGILEQLAESLFPELFKSIEIPPCKIIKSEKAAWRGMTTCVPIKKHLLRFRGIAIRYQLPYVAIKPSLLRFNYFGQALGTYLHELAHMFGGDGSAAFSNSLSEFMEVILSKAQVVAEYQKHWESHCAK